MEAPYSALDEQLSKKDFYKGRYYTFYDNKHCTFVSRQKISGSAKVKEKILKKIFRIFRIKGEISSKPVAIPTFVFLCASYHLFGVW
jgi:hypothetical protein